MTPRGGRRPRSGRPAVEHGRASISVSFPPELAAALKAHAAGVGVPVSSIVVAAVQVYLAAADAGPPEEG